LLIVAPIPVGLLLWFYAMCAGFGGGGNWTQYLAQIGLAVAFAGSFGFNGQPLR